MTAAQRSAPTVASAATKSTNEFTNAAPRFAAVDAVNHATYTRNGDGTDSAVFASGTAASTQAYQNVSPQATRQRQLQAGLTLMSDRRNVGGDAIGEIAMAEPTYSDRTVTGE